MPDPGIAAKDLTYGGYLRLDDLLSCQRPVTAAHDELLFVVIHQAYELWFKQVLHEGALLQQRLESGDSAGSLATARRIAKILKTVVGQFDILETMTPQQFSAFRPELGSSSGFQSSQFRYIEAVLGRRDFSAAVVDPVLSATVGRRPVFASLLRSLDAAGFALLADAYAAAGDAAEVCDALIDIDEGIQEWRYRHVKMVERIIGAKSGTGGSPGAAYLRGTLFRPAFPDLWEVRSRALASCAVPGLSWGYPRSSAGSAPMTAAQSRVAGSMSV
jgi:tryptophan 2,3-dioxygenase